MGGLAFASGPDSVLTPRMQPDIYRAVRDRCQEKLRELFVVVATPIEGPAKTSFGDNDGVDLFVAWEREHIFPSLEPGLLNSSPEPPKDAIYRALGAVRCRNNNENITTMAIPWPEDIPYDGNEAETNALESSEKDGKLAGATKALCIQVDVHICPSLDSLQWMLFKHAHGDLWNLLGTTIRPFGLTIDEVALYVRIPEIEEFDKKKARVLLTTDPCEVLRFLGLSFADKQWEEPFASEEELFEYAATCRLFRANTKDTENDAKNTPEPEADAEPEAIGADERKLKTNDRRRMAHRPLFRKWVEEFLPACRGSGRFATTMTTPPPPTREEVRRQAFAYFPGTQSAYESQATEWRVKRHNETLWKGVIKPAVPEDLEPNRRSHCAAALKRIIILGDASFGGIVAPATLKRPDGLFDEDAVRAWVRANWERVLDVAWEINQQRYRDKQLKGAAKRTASGSERTAETAA